MRYCPKKIWKPWLVNRSIHTRGTVTSMLVFWVAWKDNDISSPKMLKKIRHQSLENSSSSGPSCRKPRTLSIPNHETGFFGGWKKIKQMVKKPVIHARKQKEKSPKEIFLRPSCMRTKGDKEGNNSIHFGTLFSLWHLWSNFFVDWWSKKKLNPDSFHIFDHKNPQSLTQLKNLNVSTKKNIEGAKYFEIHTDVNCKLKSGKSNLENLLHNPLGEKNENTSMFLSKNSKTISK